MARASKSVPPRPLQRSPLVGPASAAVLGLGAGAGHGGEAGAPHDGEAGAQAIALGSLTAAQAAGDVLGTVSASAGATPNIASRLCSPAAVPWRPWVVVMAVVVG